MFLHLISFVSGIMILLCPSALFSKIVETQEIVDTLKYTNASSLVLFNITDTLYEPSTTLADNRWRVYFTERVKKNISDPLVTQKLTDSVKNMIVHHIPKKLVEEKTRGMIEDLQNQNIPTLGITQKFMATSYADNFSKIVSNHLLGLGINLEKTLTFLKVSEKADDVGYSFAYGIIFANKNPEGPAIAAFVKRLQPVPANIVMVDNSRQALENVDFVLSSNRIPFTGLRYGRCDERKEKFDATLGIIEFLAYINAGKIMSDTEALQIKLDSPGMDFEAMLDSYIRQK